MNVNDICDELAALIEPDTTAHDGNCARPTQYDRQTLYVWPVRESFQREGTRGLDAATDRHNFTILVAWSEDRASEVDSRLRYVSDAIVERSDAMAVVLRAHPTGTTYHDVALAEVDHEALLAHDTRGFLARITGYTLRSD